MAKNKPGFSAALSEAQAVRESLKRINGNMPSPCFIAFWLGIVPVVGFIAILISF